MQFSVVPYSIAEWHALLNNMFQAMLLFCHFMNFIRLLLSHHLLRSWSIDLTFANILPPLGHFFSVNPAKFPDLNLNYLPFSHFLSFWIFCQNERSSAQRSQQSFQLFLAPILQQLTSWAGQFSWLLPGLPELSKKQQIRIFPRKDKDTDKYVRNWRKSTFVTLSVKSIECLFTVN